MNNLMRVLVAVVSLGLMACSDGPLEGRVYTKDSARLTISNSHQALYLQDGDYISAVVEEKGKIFDSTLVLKTPSQALEIKIRKSWFSSEKTFQASPWQTGLNHELKGYPQSTFVREWDEQGTNQCDAGGDCGSFQYTYNSNGTIASMYWVSATCWGNQYVTWHKKLYHDSYRIDFGEEAYFQSNPKPREDNSVKEVLSECK